MKEFQKQYSSEPGDNGSHRCEHSGNVSAENDHREYADGKRDLKVQRIAYWDHAKGKDATAATVGLNGRGKGGNCPAPEGNTEKHKQAKTSGVHKEQPDTLTANPPGDPNDRFIKTNQIKAESAPKSKNVGQRKNSSYAGNESSGAHERTSKGSEYVRSSQRYRGAK